MLKLAHLTTHFKALGGVESIVRRHIREDKVSNFDSHCISCFEPNDPATPSVHGLGLTWRHSIAGARQKLQSVCFHLGPSALVYHNLWGMPFFADVDLSTRRIAVVHTKWPGFEKVFPNHRGLIDGALCISRPLAEFTHDNLPELTPDRIQVIPLPIDPPAISPEHPPLTGRPIRIGLCGRIEIHAKRVDRIPPLCQLLSKTKIAYSIEMLGDGSSRSWLQSRIPSNVPLFFHGQRSGKDYWDILSQWDVILFLSDFEGLPIAMLEAMSAGVIPIFPQIGCGGDQYASQISPDIVYPPGDLLAVCQALMKIQSMPPSTVESLRQRCRESVIPHSSSNYHHVFQEFITHINDLPRISKNTSLPRPFYWSDYVPFGLLRRIYLKGLFR